MHGIRKNRLDAQFRKKRQSGKCARLLVRSDGLQGTHRSAVGDHESFKRFAECRAYGGHLWRAQRHVPALVLWCRIDAWNSKKPTRCTVPKKRQSGKCARLLVRSDGLQGTHRSALRSEIMSRSRDSPSAEPMVGTCGVHNAMSLLWCCVRKAASSLIGYYRMESKAKQRKR
jgi:hypothetical protein